MHGDVVMKLNWITLPQGIYLGTYETNEWLKPGVLIEFKDGTRFLIGDINTKAGTCGCCEETGEIVKYAVLFTPEQLKEMVI